MMNTLTDYYWESERKRMMRARQKAKARLMADAIVNALLALAAIALVVLFCWWAGTRETRERAAYLEGRFGIDHATALRHAEEERNLSVLSSTSTPDFNSLLSVAEVR